MSLESTLKYYKVKVTPYFYSISARFDVDPRILFLACMYVARNHPVKPMTLKNRLWAKLWVDLDSVEPIWNAIEAALEADLLTFDEDGNIIPGEKWHICIA